MILDEKMNKQRVHTITWEDPKISARDATSISGLDYLCSIRDGKIKPPPIAMLVGYRIREVEKGSTLFELEPAEYHYNPFATVHGGIASTLLDTAMTSAVLSTLSVGLSCSTVEVKVNFIRPITNKTGIVRCKAKIIHAGNRIATAEGRIIDNNEQLYAHGVSTLMIFKQPK
jgi:uncharacterized protein (TIGR00369 family)